MMALLAGARDEAHKLYSDLSDTYQTAQANSVHLRHPVGMDDAGNKVKLASKSFRSASPDTVLNTVRSFYEELMPKLTKWIKESAVVGPGQTKPYTEGLPPYKHGSLPSPDIEDDAEFDPTIPTPTPRPRPKVEPGAIVPAGETPWYLAGGIDWRVIGGVGAGLLALTLIMKRK